MLQVKVHTSWFGNFGYVSHAREFVRALRRHYSDLLVRSSTQPENYPDPPILETDKQFLSEKTLIGFNGAYSEKFSWNKNILDTHPEEEKIHIILQPTNHPYYYEEYKGFKIAYNVWESTLQPKEFFNRLLDFNQVWVPSVWQKECLIRQGYPENKIFIVNEGINEDLFSTPLIKPEEIDGRFKFLICGKWEYRKCTEEIIRAFLYEFSPEEPVDLLVSADNFFFNKTTSEMLSRFGINEVQVKSVSFLDRPSYINLLKHINVFVSCSRGEGWGIPQLESIALGTPTILTNYGAQLEYAERAKLKVNIYGEELACLSNETIDTPGFWCAPDFEHLQELMRKSYERYSEYKHEATILSREVNKKFTWDNCAKQARNSLSDLSSPKQSISFITAGDQKFFPIIEKLVESVNIFSKHNIIVYGANSTPDIKNAICKLISYDLDSPGDKWYLKQKACIQAVDDFPDVDIFIWIDGDSIVNYNIDQVEKYFNKLLNYPLCDSHLYSQYYTFFYNEKDRTKQRTFFNEFLIKELNIKRNSKDLGHACFFIFNKDCKWFFNEILEIYNNLKKESKEIFCIWNDEGIHNLLMWKYNFKNFLPVSNFETGFNSDRVIDFFSKTGPFNFDEERGWNFIPTDKDNILYFHGNKDIKQADNIINLILKFHPAPTFFTPDGLKNFSSMNLYGSVWEIGKTNGWFEAIYHEIYNLHEYDYLPEVQIKEGDLVLDVGANIGIFSKYALEKGAKTVICFEPDPTYFGFLKRNITKAIFFNCALWSSNCTKEFYQTSHIGGSTFFPSGEFLEKSNVNCFNLDYFFQSNLMQYVDFLKIDSEGSELEIFSGISDDNLLKVNKMAIEFHCAFWQDGDHKREQLLNRFNRLNFKTYTLFMGNNNDLQMLYIWK